MDEGHSVSGTVAIVPSSWMTMHRPPPIRPMCAVLAAALLACACSCAPATRAPLRVAISPWPGYEYLYLAQERGFYEAEGVDVQLVELESLGDSRAAFENGSVDAFGSTLVELLVSHAQATRRPQAFFVADYSNGADMLLADSTIRTVADLRGKRVGLEAGSIDVIGVAAALASAGLTLRDVDLVPMPQNEKDYAFEHGTIQAVQCFPPGSADLEARPGVHRLFDSSRTPGLIVDVIVADSLELATHTARYAAFLRAVTRAQDWAAAHPEEAFALMAAREGLSPAEFAEGLAGLHIVPMNEQAEHLGPAGGTLAALKLTQEALLTTGTIARSGPLPSLVTAAALPPGAPR